MEKQKITVRVAGKEYALVSSDGAAHLSRVAAYVDRQITETVLAARTSKENAAVLVAMNLADELIKAQDDNARLRREMAAMRKEEN